MIGNDYIPDVGASECHRQLWPIFRLSYSRPKRSTEQWNGLSLRPKGFATDKWQGYRDRPEIVQAAQRPPKYMTLYSSCS